MIVTAPVARHPELEYFPLIVNAAIAKTVAFVHFTFAQKLTGLGLHHALNHQFHQIIQDFLWSKYLTNDSAICAYVKFMDFLFWFLHYLLEMKNEN